MTPDHPPPAERILAQLRQQQADSLAWQLALIATSCPELYRDAQHFVAETHALPWEFAVAFIEGAPKALREKYHVPSGRQRPRADTVAAETDLFCEACELIEQQLFAPEG